ncbi:hypothetical protein [Chitinophaga vietnamensis]|uniref:hypothetical protein n=1 Tax=Chitinophaga vietnamensis TaxID=2593957 RepID=UPI0011782D15|nr:hypothetical protein [Chitinophaga vietnamensis]
MKPDKTGEEIFPPREPDTTPPTTPENPGKCTEAPVIAPIHEPAPPVSPAEIPLPEKTDDHDLR